MDQSSRAWLRQNAKDLFPELFRDTTRHAGFGVISLPADFSSGLLRRTMVQLKTALAGEMEKRHSQTLVYQSMGRFDQQATTKFHRDGGPDQSILMLGYERSRVHSRLFIADFHKCAEERGLSAKELLANFNPLLPSSDQFFGDYAQELHAFDPSKTNIVLFNNSAAMVPNHGFLGVMHKGEIPSPNPAESRIINSTQMAIVPTGTPDRISPAEQRRFLTTQEISRSR